MREKESSSHGRRKNRRKASLQIVDKVYRAINSHGNAFQLKCKSRMKPEGTLNCLLLNLPGKTVGESSGALEGEMVAVTKW